MRGRRLASGLMASLLAGCSLVGPDFATPDFVGRAGIAAIEAGHTRYTDVAGDPALRDAIAEKYRREAGIALSRENVLVTAGAKQAVFNACQVLFEAGENTTANLGTVQALVADVVSPEQLTTLNQELSAVLDRYRRLDPAPGAERVHYFLHPLPQRSGDEA